MIRQLIRFGAVGIIATLVDVGILVALKELAHFEVLLSSAIAFCVSVTANYILSMTFVFKSKNDGRLKEFVVFVLLSVGGLCLNQLILWIGLRATAVNYLIIKFFAILIVLIYNFITRKVFLESKEK